MANVLVTLLWLRQKPNMHNSQEESLFGLMTFRGFCPEVAGCKAETAWWKGRLQRKAVHIMAARKQRDKQGARKGHKSFRVLCPVTCLSWLGSINHSQLCCPTSTTVIQSPCKSLAFERMRVLGVILDLNHNSHPT